ncbi:MAG: phosphate ABC transporter substrate-binding/OmpA family protein [Polyangiaceae bacterium]|nr:phosphate ABC transporter substrate-binding/OmpA family protein [Polyangiaceae bacterium]
MKLTPLAKGFISVIIVAVIGIVLWSKFGGAAKEWAHAGPDKSANPNASSTPLSKDDFAALGSATDADRKKRVDGIGSVSVGQGRLNRPLVVGINTWAGHSPGIVANSGFAANTRGSIYKEKYGLAVEFKIFEDPAAKLAAFVSGQMDIMWDTVDSWAREASTLAEQNVKGKAIIQQDWSRGGDGIASLKSIGSMEALKGKRIATTRYTPSHWLLLYLLNQSGLSPDDKKDIEKNLVFVNEAPLAAAAFRSKQVDAAVTWEPDLSGCVQARGNEAHVLVSTAAATNVIADTLVARQQIVDNYPETLRDFVHGWFDGIDAMAKDPAGSNEVVAKSLKLSADDVSGMLAGLKLTPFADNALFFGLGSNVRPQFVSLFDTAFVVWRKQGVISKVVDAKDAMDSRFVASAADSYAGQKVVDDFKIDATKKMDPSKQRAIVNKQISIHFVTGSDKIMEGSFFTLDALGDTMIAFGNTVLSIEGHTDNTGSAETNRVLSKARAEAVRKYLVDNFNIPDKRFKTTGFGSDKPIAPNTTEDGRMQNRRTEIKVILNVE